MTATKRDIYIEQGATYVLRFRRCENTGTVDEPVAGPPKNLTGCTARMQVRRKQHDPVLVDATTENSKIILGLSPALGTPDPTNGWISIVLSDEDTDMMSVKKAVYDMELVYSGGPVIRMLQGNVTVDPNVTQVDADDPVVVD